MKLSILVPVYNEEKDIAALLDKVAAAEAGPGVEKEIVVTDDGSTDGTYAALVEYIKARPELRISLNRQPENRGKGAAVRTAFARSTGDVVVIQDGDLEYDPGDYAALLAPIAAGEADVVYGARFTKGSSGSCYKSAYIVNRLRTIFFNVLYLTWLNDIGTCYKMMKREVFAAVKTVESKFGWDTELTAKLVRSGVRIKEVPIYYKGRTFAEGKKIGPKDVMRVFAAVVKYRFGKGAS